jgi:hypothetical protein
VAGAAASTVAIRSADARAWASSPFTQEKTENGPSRNNASPTAATSWPTVIAPSAARCPAARATPARNSPVTADIAPDNPASAAAARRVAASESRLVVR